MSTNSDNHQGHERSCTQHNTTHPLTYLQSMKIKVFPQLHSWEHVTKCIIYARDWSVDTTVLFDTQWSTPFNHNMIPFPVNMKYTVAMEVRMDQSLQWLRYALYNPAIHSHLRHKTSLFSKMSWPAPRPNQPPSEWVQGFLFLGVKQQILSTHLHVEVRQRLSGALPPLPLHNFMPYTGTTVPLSLHKLKLQRRNNYEI
jgi:hypothetical protein